MICNLDFIENIMRSNQILSKKLIVLLSALGKWEEKWKKIGMDKTKDRT